MVTREEIKQLFHIAELENEKELRRINTSRKEELSAEQKAKRLEFLVEHLNVGALIAVHQTDHFPENGKIRPTGHHLLSLASMNILGTVNTNKVVEDLQLKHPRITIHFTLNFSIKGVVAGGEWIEWAGKYAILIPIEDFIKRIVCLNPIDTWIIGALDLPSSAEILINEDDYFKHAEIYHANTGNAKIVPYPKDITIHKAIEVRLIKKGYNLTEGGDHGWFETGDLQTVMGFINNSPFLSSREKDRLVQLCIQKGFTEWSKVFEILAKKYKKETTPHRKTLWRDIEIFAEDFYGLIFSPAPSEVLTTNDEILLWKLEGKYHLAKRYQKEVTEFLHSREFNPEEVKYLNDLINTLAKIERFCGDIIHKIKSQGKLQQTWGEFLKSEKII